MTSRRESAERELLIEGTAAMIYAKEREATGAIWWHLIREDLRQSYRREAAKQIRKYERETGRVLA